MHRAFFFGFGRVTSQNKSSFYDLIVSPVGNELSIDVLDFERVAMTFFYPPSTEDSFKIADDLSFAYLVCPNGTGPGRDEHGDQKVRQSI